MQTDQTLKYPDDIAVRWIKRYARKNYWRVAAWYDLDDLVQDGFMKYCVVAQRYAHIQEPRHLMSLFMRAFHNHIISLARSHRKEPELCEASLCGARSNPYFFENIAGTVPADGPLAIMIEKAPKEIREILKLFTTDEGAEKLKLPRRRRIGNRRESMNHYLRRLCSLPTTGPNLQSALREYLSAP